MWTAIDTLPLLKGKSRELRVLFADTANAALNSGRSEDEAIFKGLAVVRQIEKSSIKKYTRPIVPPHLQAILDLKNVPKSPQEEQQGLEKANEPIGSLQAGKEVVGAEFDYQGRLTLKFKDGKKIVSNVAPITALQSSVVVVEGGTGNGSTLPVDEGIDGGSATSVFKPSEVLDGGGANG